VFMGALLDACAWLDSCGSLLCVALSAWVESPFHGA
jgi:hypothetical protein